MRNFFHSVSVCETVILNDGTYMDGKVRMAYDDATKNAVRELISFLNKGSFTRSKAFSFIARNYSLGTKALTDLWNKETGEEKSLNTMRCQISNASRALYDLFGETFQEELIRNEPQRVLGVLSGLSNKDDTFNGMFPTIVSDFISRDCSYEEEYSIDELTYELDILSFFLSDYMINALKKADSKKLAYIRNILNKPLVNAGKYNFAKGSILDSMSARNTNISLENSGSTIESCINTKGIFSYINQVLLPQGVEGTFSDEDLVEYVLERLRQFYTSRGMHEFLSTVDTASVYEAIYRFLHEVRGVADDRSVNERYTYINSEGKPIYKGKDRPIKTSLPEEISNGVSDADSSGGSLADFDD